MEILKKAGRFLSSMRFALILLGILILACVAGSCITQGQTWAWYAERYSERAAGAILALHLDDAFHSWWFMAITAFLCLNLIACNLVRLPALLKRWRRMKDPLFCVPESAKLSARLPALSDAAFRSMGFHEVKEGRTEDGRAMRYALRGRPGIFGAWICHLGILLLILGFGFGQMLKKEYTVYGVPGQTKEIGDTGLLLTIDSFTTDLHEDGSASQYTSGITIRRPADGSEAVGEARVNAPASLYGMRIYQNSTGWASDLEIQKDGTPLQSEILCAGDYAAVADKPELVIYMNAFYPDYVFDGSPSTASNELKNPAWLYSVYYQGSVIGMNTLMEGEPLTIDEYTVTFSNPRAYTLLQLKRDPLTPLAFAGALVTLLGLVLALYVQSAGMVAVTEEDGSVTVRGRSAKGGAIFEEQFEEMIRTEQNRLQEEEGQQDGIVS